MRKNCKNGVVFKLSRTEQLFNIVNTEIMPAKEKLILCVNEAEKTPNVSFELEGGVSADDYKYAVYICKIPLSFENTWAVGDIFFCKGEERIHTSFGVSRQDEFLPYIFSFENREEWCGTIDRVDLEYYRTPPKLNDYCVVDSVIFCKTRRDAELYAARYTAVANERTCDAELSASDIIPTFIKNASRDKNSSEYVCGQTLCLSAGLKEKVKKEKIESRIASSIFLSTGADADVEIAEGFEELLSEYHEDKAEKTLEVKITYNGESVTKELSVKLFVKEVIFDNDLGSDVDDAGAVAMALRDHNEGYCKLLAITSCATNRYTPLCLKYMCEQFGVEGVEIGQNRDRATHDSPQWYNCTKGPSEKYALEEKYPDEFPSAVGLIRKLLAKSKGNVTVITTGALATIYPLMLTEPDEDSPLAGDELFREKVGHYVCGGGNFPSGVLESNFYCDKDGVEEVVNNYLAGYPITFVGAEVAGRAQSSQCFAEMYDYIVRDIYLGLVDQNRLYAGYSSWDQGVEYYAIHGTADGLFRTEGNIKVTPFGLGRIDITENGCHEHVIKTFSFTSLAEVFNARMIP